MLDFNMTVEPVSKEIPRLRGLVVSLKEAAEACATRGCPSYIHCFLVPGSYMPNCSRQTRDNAIAKLKALGIEVEKAE